MKFAMDTVKDVATGSLHRKVHALLTFSLWFVAGAFIVSTGQHYLDGIQSDWAPYFGGALASAGAAAIKFTQRTMLPGAWGLVASPGASLFVGFAAFVCLVRSGYHRDSAGALSRRKMASVFLLGAATYTFVLLAASDLMIDGPEMEEFIKFGFGTDRVAWLMTGISLDGVFRIWDEFRVTSGDRELPTEQLMTARGMPGAGEIVDRQRINFNGKHGIAERGSALHL